MAYILLPPIVAAYELKAILPDQPPIKEAGHHEELLSHPATVPPKPETILLSHPATVP